MALYAPGCIGLKDLPVVWPEKLELLDLQGCENLTIIPRGVWELRNLRNLCLQGCNKLMEFPCSRLLNLEYIGLPLISGDELARKLKYSNYQLYTIQQRNGVNLKNTRLYLETGQLNKEWIKDHEEVVNWLPWGSQYKYLSMKVSPTDFIVFHQFDAPCCLFG